MRLLRFLPLLVLVAIAITLLALGVTEQLAPSALLERANGWLALADRQPLRVFAVITGAIIASTALGLPGAVALFGVSGFLVGVPLTLVAGGLGNMVGTALLYQAIRSAFYQPRDELRVDDGLLARARARFNRNPFAFAFFLRALPVTPNGMNTALLAALRCPWPTFLASSALAPLANAGLVGWLGAQLAEEARAGRLPDASILSDPRWWLPLMMIALMALSPLLLKRRRAAIAVPSDS